MTKLKDMFVWVILWVIGAAVFDLWLELKGSWLMLGGVFTYLICDLVQEAMRDYQRGLKNER